MYFPYFRGKQNELILLRDNAELIGRSQIIPIIEPVKLNTKPLLNAINSLCSESAELILITNPIYGDFSGDADSLAEEVLTEEALGNELLVLGYIVGEHSDIDDFLKFSQKYSTSKIALIHYGYLDAVHLIDKISNVSNIDYHIFIDKHASRMYRRRFKCDVKKVLLEDGFEKQDSNRKYPDAEHFSDLHITYEENSSLFGFGDFLISGIDYSESGGPAYSVAIHLTWLNSEMENDMYINHYKSVRNSTPADPGGKFLEALEKLIDDLKKGDIYISDAVKEFRLLHSRGHFPGLGIVKKLSMQHHVELIADYLQEQ